MKVIQINSVYNVGSTGRIVKTLHEQLVKEGHQSMVLYGRYPQETEDSMIIYMNDVLSGAYHLFCGLMLDRHGLYSKNNTRKIIEKIQSFQPDVLHLHNIHGFYLNYEMLFEYIKTSRIKVVWTLHDCWSYTGYCSYYDYNQCDGWKSGCKNCSYKNVYPYRFFSNSKDNFNRKQIFRLKDQLVLVTPSKWLASEVKHSFLQEVPVQVINNDVDLDAFVFTESNLKTQYDLEGKTIILSVAGQWTLAKGYNEYIKLASMLDESFQIVLVGCNEKQIMKLPKNILGVPRTSSTKELAQWYSVADVFVNLTLQENYPTVNLEAKACGTPIITYNTGGASEMVEGYGTIVDKYDLNSIVELLNKKEFERKESVIDSYCSMATSYLELYKEMGK